ncbi:MAG: hypothetical protein JNJ90_01690 [Saprospiraceae bacterium]|jgi:anti-sigma factor RsiW|nr:hypothetical protein [Saprospiraceae bacterium]
MNNSENTDQIMRYDTGEMDEAERLAFEARLAKDAELQADYAAYQALAGFLHQLSEGRMLRAQWEDMRAHVHEEASAEKAKSTQPRPLSPPKPSRGRVVAVNFRWIMAVAASFALLLCALWWWQGPYADRQLNELAAANLPATTALIRRQLPAGYGADAESKAYRTVLERIEQGHAAAALPVLDQVAPGPFADFLRGICLSVSETPAQAIPILEPFTDDPEPFYRQAAAWHLALVYARAGDRNKAEKMIRIILEDPTSPYLDGAKKLQTRINNPFAL